MLAWVPLASRAICRWWENGKTLAKTVQQRQTLWIKIMKHIPARQFTKSFFLITLLLLMSVNIGLTATGLDFPGSAAVTSTMRLRFLNPLAIYPATYIWRAYPRRQTYYYTTFFWGNDDGNNDLSTFQWDGGNSNTFYGAHPYPIWPNYTSHKWEIATDHGGDFLSAEDVVYDRWYTQALVAWSDGSGNKHTDFYWDLPDTSKVVSHTTGSIYGNTNPPVPALTFGDAPWNPGNEVYDGILRGIRVYSTNLSMTDILSEASSPLSTSAGAAKIWYLNMDPTPSDISDKSGKGHNPSWVGSERPSLYTDSQAPQTFNLSIAKAGTGSGTVTSSPAGINCGSSCSGSYNSGTAVTLTAAPAAGSIFSGWTGNADCSDGSVTMDANKSCTATFNPQPVQPSNLSIAKAGTGIGTVTSSPAGINCGSTCSGTYNSGTAVTLTATPAAGSTFTGWSGTGCTNGVVTMNANTTCTATFNSLPSSQTFTLSIVKLGTGAGTVTSTPAGINCGSSCSGTYNSGTTITLTATLAAGSTFAGWSGK